MLLRGLRLERLRRFSKKEAFHDIHGDALRAEREQMPDLNGLRSGWVASHSGGLAQRHLSQVHG